MDIKKKILITAGPTWVAIDSVRVISNIATGETGILLAERLAKDGAEVTLILGPVSACCLNKKIKVIIFKFFEELKSALEKELSLNRYDAVIHAAAVSDYTPKKIFRTKISSGLKELHIKLIPSLKLIDSIKKIDPSVFLVGIKFEPQAGKKEILKVAKLLMRRAKLDLVVANTLKDKKYQAYIIDKKKFYGQFANKRAMADKLVKLIGDLL